MHSSIRLLVILLTMLTIPFALPNEASAFTPEQENLYLRGKAELKAQQYPEAAKTFETVLEQIKLNNENKWQLLVALAVTFDKWEKWVPALEYYERFLRALTPHLSDTDEKWRGRYELAVQTRHDLQARLSATHSRISLDSEPQGATVWINGKKAGFNQNAVTPFVAYVTPGDYTFALTATGPRGATRAEKTMQVELNKTQSWMAAMREQTQVLDSISIETERPINSMERPYAGLGWTLFGSGIASAAGGLFFTFQALDTQNSLGAMTVTPTQDAEQSRNSWNALNEDLESQEITSWICYGVGAALIGTGASLLLVERESEGETTSGFDVSLQGFWGTGAAFSF